MRDLAAVVKITTLPVFNARQGLASGCAIGSEFISHDHPGPVAQALQQLAKESPCRLGGTAPLNQHVQHIAALTNGPSEKVQVAADSREHFIRKPFVAGLSTTALQGLGADLSGAQPPFVANHNAPRRQDQLDLPQTQAESVIQPDGLGDNFGWKAEAMVRVGCHAHDRDPAICSDHRQPDMYRATLEALAWIFVKLSCTRWSDAKT
jgi:hypothetical protein